MLEEWIVNISLREMVLSGALAVLFLMQIFYYARYMCAPARKLRRKASSGEQPAETPGVSVILCAHNEAYNLSQYLQALLTQDYPEYEVIVVDDGSEDDTRAVIENYQVNDPRLRRTFVPIGARVRSTKKLALTLAAKAAKYDYLLLIEADCVPESKHWISAMMSGFKADKDIVLGFSAYFEEKGHLNRLMRYEGLFNGLHYLGAALCGHPYMGVGRNLAYRKSLFFESGGFTHQMNTQQGDDDLFVNHVATKKNTAVVVARESYTWSRTKKTMKEWFQQRRRHLEAVSDYREGTKARLAFEPTTRALFYLLSIALVAWYQVSIVSLAVLALFLLRWMFQSAVINVSARRMGLKRFSMFSVLWFDIVLPIVTLWMLIVPKRVRKKW